MSRLTLKEAIELSLSLCWREMAKEGWQVKESLSTFGELTQYLNYCPLCEHLLTNCQSCPLSNNKKHCLTPNSLFDKWVLARGKQGRQQAAQAIVSKLEKALGKLT